MKSTIAITICLTNLFINLFLSTSDLGRFDTDHKWIPAVQGMGRTVAIGVLLINP